MSFIGSILGGGGHQTPPPRQQAPSGQPDGGASGNGGNADGAGTGGVGQTTETQSGAGASGSQSDGAGAGTGGPSTGASARLMTAPTATPYVAPPTVTAEDVAEVIERAPEAPDARTEEDRARSFAEAARDRSATEALIAAIQPPPERAPSLRDDVAAVRGFGSAEPGGREPEAA